MREETIYYWIKAFKKGRFPYTTSSNAISLNEEFVEFRKRVKDQEREIRRLKEEIEFLEEVSAFFAVSRWKSAKNRE